MDLRRLRSIKFDHPVLFKHAVAAVSMHGVSVTTCGRIWRLDRETEAKPEADELRSARARAVRTVIQNEYWPSQNTAPPHQMAQAFYLAGALHSLGLLDDLRTRFPHAVSEDLQSVAMQQFLWSCSENGFTDGLRLIPHSHPVLSMRDEDQRTLLEEACYHNRPDAVQVLIDLGAAVDPPDIPAANFVHLSYTPLIYAVTRGLHALTRLLLAFGADPAAPTNFQFDLSGTELTTLEFAVTRNDSTSVRILLEAGVDDVIKIRALRLACMSANSETVAVLIDHGADVAHPSHRPPLLHAALSTRPVSNPPDVRNMVRLLLERGATVDETNDNGLTPLHSALTRGYTDVATVLLDAGADATRRSAAGWTVLHFVAEAPRWHGDIDLDALLDRLMRMGVEATALHAAAQKRRKEFLLWLLGREGIDVGKVDSNGKTWLEVALDSGSTMKKWLNENVATLAATGVNITALGQP
ncbi:B-cell lymphoma 3 protein [Phlyctochytrium bullatum]|nr:B-cell lymphoma 3 protein [Phlyctochytrium bullatum]